MWSRTFKVCCLAIMAPCSVYGCDYFSSFPHRASCYDYYYNYPPHLYFDLSRLEGELRRQRITGNVERRKLDREIDALRQQAFTNQQVSATQACYYRTTGGFELCADLFTEKSLEREQCEALVIRRNPGCNEHPSPGQHGTE